ncbi:copper amine oxidase N-terminal domain-containing protein [Paenibacillus algicola]|nr:copper amine oxidase N-terminal domain-containing protein [Paenibacillus algicola]
MTSSQRFISKSHRQRAMSLLLAASLLGSTLAASAAWGAENQNVVLSLKQGSPSADINGAAAPIVKPVIKQGHLMVPLGVFSKAFGSQVTLEGTTRVTLLQGPHRLVMTIGSSTAWIDGRKIVLPVEPQMISDTLMVPLRAVAQGLGAKVGVDSKGRVSITMKVQDKQPSEEEGGFSGESVNQPTRIGNSYYGWSIDYPSGMMVNSYAGDESSVEFVDATGRYYMELYVSDAPEEQEPKALLAQLLRNAEDAGDLVVHREIVSRGSYPYARIFSRDSDEFIWETRMYYDNGRVYELYFADRDAVHYRDMSAFGGLLNSFQPVFPEGSAKAKVKDLSSVEEGLRMLNEPDYGITVGIPADWMYYDEYYYGKEGEGGFLMDVHSAPEGQQGDLKQWVQQLESYYADTFVPDAYELEKAVPISISGQEGQMVKVRYVDRGRWYTEYSFLIQHEGYRYELTYRVDDESTLAADMWEAVLASMIIDYDVVPGEFGNLGTPAYLQNSSAMVKRSSKAYAYTVSLPENWSSSRDWFESGNVEYELPGGTFEIDSVKNTARSTVLKHLQAYYNDKTSSSFGESEAKGLGVRNITLAGVPAVSFELHFPGKTFGHTERYLVFERDGIVHTVTIQLEDANATATQLQTLERVLQSVR